MAVIVPEEMVNKNKIHGKQMIAFRNLLKCILQVIYVSPAKDRYQRDFTSPYLNCDKINLNLSPQHSKYKYNTNQGARGGIVGRGTML
jgi:hypothetical protein